ncbi:DUF4157 domain-containing protein [Laspinema sp. D1]|uniref:DUF4157 domain-containing protein n=1 Tax=Laspinema palackyanum D2a TaxID=2953684 RepID=A0ABT2MW34_9CYAN|nr:DUF4157 domain-containing protein [Laspinema sp. D2a]
MASGRKIQRNQPTATSVPQTGLFQPRPFAAPAQPETASPQVQQTPEVQAKLENQPTSNRLSRVDFSAPPPIQPKLTIGAPGDKYEQEADTIARKVVQQIHAPASPEAPAVQRQIVPTPVAQGHSFHSAIMPKLTIQRQDEEAAPDLESSISRAKSSGSPLDNAIRPKMEGAFGADFSGVRVHTDANSDTLNRSISARAFTTGQHIFFKKGEYNPSSSGGQELLAHELTHVVQQTSNNVQRKEQPLITQQAENTTIQRALGKYNGSSFIEKSWVFYRKNPQITPLGLSGFNFANSQVGSIVIMGTPSQVQSDINRVSGQDMLVSFAHEISGQFQNYRHNEEDAYYDRTRNFNFQLSASVDRVTLGGPRMQEVLDVRGMVINQLTNDLVGFALGVFQGAYEPKIWTDMIQGGTDAYGVYQNLKEPKAYPDFNSNPQTGTVVDIVTISPVIMPGSDSWVYATVDVGAVKDGATSVIIPSAKIQELLGYLPIFDDTEVGEYEEGGPINPIYEYHSISASYTPSRSRF